MEEHGGLTPFEDEGERIIRAAMAALYVDANEVMNVSQVLCPLDTGTLRASGRVFEPDRVGPWIICVLGYGYGDQVNPKTGQTAAGYAIPVHEIIEARHEPPTQAKFLEGPVLAHAAVMGPNLAAFITRAEKTVGGLRTWQELIHDFTAATGTELPIP